VSETNGLRAQRRKEFCPQITQINADYLLQYLTVDIGLSRKAGLPISTVKFCNKCYHFFNLKSVEDYCKGMG